MPTVLITGVSSGIGLEFAKQFAARGDKVYGTVRARGNSKTKEDKISAVEGDVTVIEGIDVGSDSCIEPLKAALAGVTLDLVIHNAGTVNATRELDGMDIFADQQFAKITMDRMRDTFEVNTLGPLRVQQALMPNTKSPGGKVVVMSTGMGSIGDNGSGGLYAYRTSKAAVNMVAKGMAMDFKKMDNGICCIALAPGTVVTEFGGGSEMMAKMGGQAVEPACKTMLQVIDDMSMDNTGKYMMVPTSGDPPKEFPW